MTRPSLVGILITLIGIALLALAVLRWLGDGPPTPTDSRPPGTLADVLAFQERDDFNVLFILVDTLRADHLSAYGYSREYKEYSITSQQLRQLPPDCPGPGGKGTPVFFNAVVACQNGITAGTEEEVFAGTAGSAALTFDIVEDGTKSVYFKYSRGWKPGHFNGGAVISQQLIEPVKPDTVDSLEAGVKSSWLDGLLVVDAAAFAYDYKDIQIFQIESDIGVGPIPQLINAQGARIYGAEIDLSVEPFEGLSIRFNAAYLDTEYSKFETTVATPIPPLPDELPPPKFEITDVIYTGNRMVGSPEWSMTGSIQYTAPIGRLGELTPRFSFSYKDDVFFDVAEGRGIRHTEAKPALPEGTIGEDDFWLLNASLAWTSPDQTFAVRAWVRNMLEKAYRVQSFDLTEDSFRAVIDAYGPPRTFGVTTTVRF